MRVGILTLPLNTNYGGILQCYALQTILERMGHEVTVLNIHLDMYRLPLWKVPLAYGKRFVKKYILHNSTAPIRYEKAIESIQQEETTYTRRFIDKYIHTISEGNYYTLSESDFDAIVVGSDQVWRPAYFPNTKGLSIADAYLDFAKDWDIKRMSYAASYGTSQWEYSPAMTERCRQLIQRFDMVTVREADAVTMVKEKLGVDAKLVLDPTLLLDREDYTRLICRAEQVGVLSPAGGYGDFLMSYILDENQDLTAQIRELAISTGMEVRQSKAASVSIRDFDPKEIERYIQPPVENWLRDFRDCKYVVTDSFHACVFSIIFRKPFVVLGNEKRGMARFESLLGMLGLHKRMATSSEEISPILLDSIDYDSVTNILVSKRAECIALLEKHLKNG